MAPLGLFFLAQLAGSPFSSAPSAYQPGAFPASNGPGFPNWSFAAKAHRDHEMRELRAEALRVQAKDGGALTPEHRAEFQQKLEALNRHLARVNN